MTVITAKIQPGNENLKLLEKVSSISLNVQYLYESIEETFNALENDIELFNSLISYNDIEFKIHEKGNWYWIDSNTESWLHDIDDVLRSINDIIEQYGLGVLVSGIDIYWTLDGIKSALNEGRYIGQFENMEELGCHYASEYGGELENINIHLKGCIDFAKYAEICYQCGDFIVERPYKHDQRIVCAWLNS